MANTSNVDRQEVAKFEALAHRWWDPNSEFKPLHDINPLRANYIDLHSQVAGKRVIDVGCGGGLLSEALSHRGAVVTGVDAGEGPLAVAKLHQLESGVEVEYLNATAEAMAEQRPAQYDVVACLEMIEHVPDPGSVIRACAALAKPGADLYFSTINRNPKAFLLAIVGAEYVLNMLPRGTHEYAKFIKPSELARWLREAGLELVEIVGMSFNPITQVYSLGKDTDVNYLVRARKPA